MSSIDIKNAHAAYKAETEAGMLLLMAQAHGCRLIYQYANDYGDKTTLTDYKIIMEPGDAQEQAFLNSRMIHNAILVYKEGKVVHEPLEGPTANGVSSSALPTTAVTSISSDQGPSPEMRCSKCGVPVQPADLFCRSCGTALPVQKESSASGQSVLPPKLPTASSTPGQPGNKSPVAATVGKLDLGGNKVSRSASASSKTAGDLKKDLRGWGIGMIVWGLLSFILTQYLDPVWGGIIIVLGIVNLLVINRALFIVNGLALIVVGVLNIISVIATISTAGISSFWMAYGFMQIGWGFQEVFKFDKFSPMREFSTYPVGLSGAVGRFTVIPMERNQVETPSIVSRQTLYQHLERVARFWVNEGKPSRAELMISGYDRDPRELYEIPEVCEWARRAVNESPVLPYFLTSTSLDRFTGWLCGPVSKEEITTREFEERFVQARNKYFDIAFQASTPYLRRMGASAAAVSKFNSQLDSSHNEAVKIGLDGHAYTAAVMSKGEMRKYRKILPRMVMRQYPWTIVVGVIMGIVMVAGIAVAVFWASGYLPKPSITKPLNNNPTLSETNNSSGQICWTKEVTGFDGNRSQAWEQYLDAPTKEWVPFDIFKDDVVVHNPVLKTEGYVFFGQKTYLLPELCP